MHTGKYRYFRDDGVSVVNHRFGRPNSVPAGMSSSPSFWRQLARPLFCVAPMANVTDVAFRRIISDLAKPSVLKALYHRRRVVLKQALTPRQCVLDGRQVMWTEFVSCEALTHDAASRARMVTTLQYAEQERPVVAQLFGSKPEQFYEVPAAAWTLPSRWMAC